MEKNTDEPIQRIAALERERDALAAALGWVKKRIRFYVPLDSTVPIFDGRRIPRYAIEDLVDACDSEKSQAILAARLAAERKAGAVEALKRAFEYWNDTEPIVAAYLKYLATQIERGEVK